MTEKGTKWIQGNASCKNTTEGEEPITAIDEVAKLIKEYMMDVLRVNTITTNRIMYTEDIPRTLIYMPEEQKKTRYKINPVLKIKQDINVLNS